MKRNFDVIVIGTGGVGSAAAYHLAKQGVSVLGLDRFAAGHDRGSSHGETRVIRKAYFEHPGYVPLLQRAYDLWDELQSESQLRLFQRHPLVEVGPPDGLIVPGVLKAAQMHDLKVEEMSEPHFRSEFPALHLPEGSVAVKEDDAGILFVEDCVREHIRRAEEHGAEFLNDVEVTGWSASEGTAEVTTNIGVFSCAHLIITAGAWAGQLLSDCGMKLRVLKKHLHWFESDAATSTESGFPLFFYEVGERFFYGFPKLDGKGVKVAEHSDGEEIADPLTVDREIEKGDADRVEDFTATYLRGVSQIRTQHKVCFYTMTEDGNFIIDRHPEYRNVAFAAGLSGHGFKFTSVLGEILADLARGGRPPKEIEFLSLK